MKKTVNFLVYLFLFFGTAISPLLAQTGSDQVNKNPPASNSSNPASVSASNKNPSNPFEDILRDETQTNNDHFFAEFIHMLTVLGFIIGLILIVAWILKKMLNTRIQQVNTTSDIKILERRSLSPKTTIYILDIKGLSVAVAESQNGATLLGPIKNNNDGDEKNAEKASDFQQIMQSKTNANS